MVMYELVKSHLICCHFKSGQLQLKFKSFGFFNRELECEFQSYQDTAIGIVEKKYYLRAQSILPVLKKTTIIYLLINDTASFSMREVVLSNLISCLVTSWFLIRIQFQCCTKP